MAKVKKITRYDSYTKFRTNIPLELDKLYEIMR